MTTTTTTRPGLAAALAAAKRGWPVFPLVPGAKRPAVRDWENRATTDPERINRCWSHAPYGVGIACGPAGLVVVDLDKPKPGYQWPNQWRMVGVFDGADVFTVVAERAGQPVPFDTHTVTTASGGTHLYYQAPAGIELRNTQGDAAHGLGPLIDTRAHGGYVAAPGTTLTDAGTYTITHDTTPAPLPGWLTTALTPPPPPPPAAPVRISAARGDRTGRYVAAAVNRQVDTISDAAAAGDGRKRAVFHSAVALGQLVAGGALAETEAATAIESAALAAGLTPHVIAPTIRSGFRYGARRPRHIEVTS